MDERCECSGGGARSAEARRKTDDDLGSQYSCLYLLVVLLSRAV